MVEKSGVREDLIVFHSACVAQGMTSNQKLPEASEELQVEVAGEETEYLPSAGHEGQCCLGPDMSITGFERRDGALLGV